MFGILCGLESEAAIARRIPGALVACAAARPGKARALARELVDNGATRLMSFGVAGGLKPGLPVGALVIGTHVTSYTGTWDCDETWAKQLMQKLHYAEWGGVWGSEVLVPTVADKRMLYEQSGCAIVDMESQCVAQIAAETKLPFTVLRAVCDTAAMHVPPVVMKTIGEDGRIHALRAITHLARQPAEIPALFHMMRGIRQALNELKDALVAF